MGALTLVGEGVEVVGRVGIREPSPTPRELHAEPVVRAKRVRLHLPHDKHRQRADDDLTGRHSVAERDNLARRNALVADASQLVTFSPVARAHNGWGR